MIRKGDIGIIWLSGRKAGIYATTEILTDPGYMKEPPEESKYWISTNDQSELKIRVRMTITNNLVKNPILRNNIKTTIGLKNLSILRQPRGTNFPVSLDECVSFPLFRSIQN